MPPPAPRPRLRKREIALAIGAGALASFTAAAILSDGFGGPGSSFIDRAEQAATQAGEATYQLGEFQEISSTGPQDLEIKFGDTYSVRADGAVGSLEVVVEDGELIVRPRDGFGWNLQGLGATKVFVTLPQLNRIALTGSGNVSIDQVKGERFTGVIEGFAGDLKIDGIDVDQAEFTINGPGEITAAGTARALRMTVNGPGEVHGGELQSQTAVIAVRGPGDVELTVQEHADVSVEGPGEVDIDGPARCSISTAGPGSVSCGETE
jgi:hypothetical protein